MNEPVAQAGLLLRRDHLFQGHFHLIGILAAVLGGQPKLSADADAVGIRHDGGVAVDIRQDQVSGLSANARQLEQFLHGIRDLSAVLLQQHDRGVFDIIGLGAEQAAGLYDGAKFLDIRRRKGFQRGETLKENRRHQIDPGIGTLGGQARGEQQLIVLLCLKGTGIRIMLF